MLKMTIQYCTGSEYRYLATGTWLPPKKGLDHEGVDQHVKTSNQEHHQIGDTRA